MRPAGTSLLCLLFLLPFRVPVRAANDANPVSPQLGAYATRPLYFEANRGQADNLIQFLARGRGYSFALAPTEATIALSPPDSSDRLQPAGPRAVRPRPRRAAYAQLIHMHFAGATGPTRMVGVQELAGRVNYFLGNDPTQWHGGISTFAQVRYEQLYPGVDLLCYGNQQQLEYDFIVEPGASLNSVSLRFDGVDYLEIDRQGDLVLHAAGGEIRQRKPLIYQASQGVRKEITGGYVLKESCAVGFEVAAY